MGFPIKSASAHIYLNFIVWDDEEKGYREGRKRPPFGGCLSVLLRARDTAYKYTGNCKTKGPWPERETNGCEFVLLSHF